jgi:CheY-like chemotaxis protein
MRVASILIVEDEWIIADDLQRKVRRLGYAVSAVVSSGRAAIEHAATSQPDLILMDLGLRGEMDGVQAAQSIREHCNAPVVYVTAHADDATLARAEHTQPLGYVFKPFVDDELRHALEHALRPA